MPLSRPTPPGSVGEMAGLCPRRIWFVLDRLKRSYTSLLLFGRWMLKRCLAGTLFASVVVIVEAESSMTPLLCFMVTYHLSSVEFEAC